MRAPAALILALGLVLFDASLACATDDHDDDSDLFGTVIRRVRTQRSERADDGDREAQQTPRRSRPVAPLRARWAVDVIDATHGLHDWTDQFSQRAKTLRDEGRYPETGYYECRETVEISRAFLCQWPNPEEMNRALIRASMFVEGGVDNKIGNVPDADSEAVAKTAARVGGHDLKGSDLIRFFDAARKLCDDEGQKRKCLTPAEQRFFLTALPTLRRIHGRPRGDDNENESVVITYPATLRSKRPPSDIASHELMHAHYMLQTGYKDAVDDFWHNEMTEDDHQLVKNALRGLYDVDSHPPGTEEDYLAKNEFQAYMLMNHPENGGSLAKFVDDYRPRLMAKMQKRRITPIQVEW